MLLNLSSAEHCHSAMLPSLSAENLPQLFLFSVAATTTMLYTSMDMFLVLTSSAFQHPNIMHMDNVAVFLSGGVHAMGPL